MSDQVHLTRHDPDGIIRSCEQCGTPIGVGQPRVYVSGIYEGEPYDYSLHVECHAAAGAYATVFGCWGEDEFPWFQHHDYDQEQAEWIGQHHPICAARLEWPHRYDDDGELLPFKPATTPGAAA